MKAPVRLGLYALVLAAVFAVAGFTANTVVPEETVQNWTQETDQPGHMAGADEPGTMAGADEPGTADGQGHADDASSLGLGVAAQGYRLTGLTAPGQTGRDGTLALTITGPDGQPVTDFDVTHEQELHLIVVRGDGQQFRHVHPTMDAEGTWRIPWQWDVAGSYRVFADFVPSARGETTTVSTSAQVAGDYEPVPTEPVAATTVDGYRVSVQGELVTGKSSELVVNVSREGEPVTELEPYLGAFGHLVALREGDLAYLHVHPHGDEPQAGELSGPDIVFEAEAPTPGRYLLYLDFQIGGKVRTAALVLDAPGSPDAQQGENEQPQDTEEQSPEHDEEDDHEHG